MGGLFVRPQIWIDLKLNILQFFREKCMKYREMLLTFLVCSLREKCPNTEFSLVRIFLYLNWIRRFSPAAFSPNTGKYGPEKTQCLDTFHAVILLPNLQTVKYDIPTLFRQKLVFLPKFLLWSEIFQSKLLQNIQTSKLASEQSLLNLWNQRSFTKAVTGKSITEKLTVFYHDD